MTADDFSREFYKLASSFRLSTTGEITTVSISGLQENFDKTVTLYEDLINNCKPDEQALASLKQRLKKSRENAKLNKGAIMQGLVNYAQYGPKNPFNNVLTDEELDAVKADDLIALLHSLASYKPIILYYGPKTAADAASEISDLHKTPATFTTYPAGQTFVKISQDTNRVLFANFDMVQAEIEWIRNSNAYNSAETSNIELFNNYFGNNMSSIVFQTLRESKALAYATYAFYVTPGKKEDRYSVQAYIGAQAAKFNEAIKGMNDLITDLPESEKVLESAKENIHKSIETERITQDGILFDYLDAQRKGLDYDIRKTTFENVDKLGLADVKAFHDQEFKNKPFTYCVVASEKRVSDDDLKKYGALTKLSLKELFGY
jgi:predicted Zn-dependent peptidase